MIKVWRPDGGIQFREVGENKFLLEFQYERYKEKVMWGRPWSFDRLLVCLKEFKGNTLPKGIYFPKEYF